MKELTNSPSSNRRSRWCLLATASIGTLVIGCFGQVADAADTFLASGDHPVFWIELGGDLEHIAGQTDRWMPPERGVLSGSAFNIRKDPAESLGMEGKISYLPEDSSWVFWASARYGRSQRQQAFHTQTHVQGSNFAANYTATSRHTENHMVVDFAVGRDVGLGLSGKSGHAIISAGVRIAQFSLNSKEFASSAPNDREPTRYYESARIERRTSAMGPMISFDASLPVFVQSDASLMFDWDAGGAILFGRQKVSSHIANHYDTGSGTNSYGGVATDFVHARSVVIPNLSAFAGVSYRLPAAKVSLGYRADIYFGGVDGGMIAANRINHSFYGPFAAISFGIGD